MVERISQSDESFVRCYGIHAQRYAFASEYCQHKRVLDAGCGTGYGSGMLARLGAASVLGLDISDEALAEADRIHARDNVAFAHADLHSLTQCPSVQPPYDTVINFENLEHLSNPTAFLDEVTRVLAPAGTFLVTTPNGELTERKPDGRPMNPYHVEEYTLEQLRDLLEPRFESVRYFGQWMTYDGQLRVLNEQRNHAYLCGLYYNPAVRLGRAIGKLLGRAAPPPPQLDAFGDARSDDYVILPLDEGDFPWKPTILLAECTGKTTA